MTMNKNLKESINGLKVSFEAFEAACDLLAKRCVDVQRHATDLAKEALRPYDRTVRALSVVVSGAAHVIDDVTERAETVAAVLQVARAEMSKRLDASGAVTLDDLKKAVYGFPSNVRKIRRPS